jgi:hypothetical protein
MQDNSDKHVELVRSLESFFRAIGFDSEGTTDVATDLADILYAATDAHRLVDGMLAADIENADDAKGLLQMAADIDVQLFTELKDHLESLEQAWPGVLDAVERLADQHS